MGEKFTRRATSKDRIPEGLRPTFEYQDPALIHVRDMVRGLTPGDIPDAGIGINLGDGLEITIKKGPTPHDSPNQ